jgi:hypothetical protein
LFKQEVAENDLLTLVVFFVLSVCHICEHDPEQDD